MMFFIENFMELYQWAIKAHPTLRLPHRSLSIDFSFELIHVNGIFIHLIFF